MNHISETQVAEVVARSSARQLGASVIEYALLMALIAIACISALSYFGGESGNSVNNSADCIINAGTDAYNC